MPIQPLAKNQADLANQPKLTAPRAGICPENGDWFCPAPCNLPGPAILAADLNALIGDNAAVTVIQGLITEMADRLAHIVMRLLDIDPTVIVVEQGSGNAKSYAKSDPGTYTAFPVLAARLSRCGGGHGKGGDCCNSNH